MLEAARLFAHPLRAGTLRAWSLSKYWNWPPKLQGDPSAGVQHHPLGKAQLFKPLPEGGPWKIFPSLFSASPTQSHPLPKALARSTLPFPRRHLSAGESQVPALRPH